MGQINAMVSSTCFDLAAAREQICTVLESLGFNPVMSEHATFPVLPGLSPFDNCRRVAREEADLLVLVVGGRRGSTAPGTNATITNVEYREARASGIPVFVFVQSRVWEARPLWR